MSDAEDVLAVMGEVKRRLDAKAEADGKPPRSTRELVEDLKIGLVKMRDFQRLNPNELGIIGARGWIDQAALPIISELLSRA